MNFSEIGDWILAYWFELGSLVIQGAILATVAWYGRKAFRLQHGSPAQKPQQTQAPVIRPPRQPLQAMVRASGNGIRGLGRAVARSWRCLSNWLQTPAGGSLAPVRRAKRWLQAPTHS